MGFPELDLKIGCKCGLKRQRRVGFDPSDLANRVELAKKFINSRNDPKILKDHKGDHIMLDTENHRTQYESKILNPAVSVENARKRYGSGPSILNDFTMTVQRGTIYGLLGSSGCGKTTILSCIIGLKKLESGDIKVFGSVPGTKESGIPICGYMPQDIALYQIFTIKEVLQYYGRIYGMTQVEILARMEFLLSFLDLPDCTRRISDLSGGQQRRTSLAVAMIHEPELLILDEPTVGVDPLVRESIWDYLCEIVKRKRTTVIITTHYIEEARQSHMIGLMRTGRLITEKPPMALLEEHNAILLEEIVLKLCKKDTEMITSSSYTDEVKQAIEETSFYSRKNKLKTDSPIPVLGLTYKPRSPDDLTIVKPRRSQLDRSKKSKFGSLCDRAHPHISKVRSLVIKNSLTLLRYPMFLLILLFIPALQIVLFNFIAGSDPKNSLIGVVNLEFQSLDYLETCRKESHGCFTGEMSCKFLNTYPQDTFVWVPFSSEQEALESVQRGKTVGFISIPANFTQDLKDRSLLRNFAANETLIGSEISSRLDMSYSIKAKFIQVGFYKYYLEFIKSIVSDCGGDPKSVELPLKYRTPIYGSLETGYQEYMQPAQLLLIIFILPMTSAVTFVWDKKAGTFDRTMVAGVEYYHFLTAFIISEGLLIIAELLLCFGVLIFLFDFTIKGSVFLSFLLSFLQGITGLSFGFLFGTLCEHELEVLISIIGLYMPVFTSSGGTWPLESVSGWLRPFCELLPVTLPLEAFRSIISRDWGIGDAQVWHGFAVLICWIFLNCTISGVVHRRRK